MEKFSNYSTIEKLMGKVKLPNIFPIKQTFPNEYIKNVASETRRQLENNNMRSLIRPGMSIAVTAGSRGIANINIILREIVSFLIEAGAKPFIVAAMGSHGGATADGQLNILTSYGITKEFCGCPIISRMDTVHLGNVHEGSSELPVYIDKAAYEADGIVVVNRIKPHTSFRADVESGLTKMLCIGLGKQRGAESMHAEGFGTFSTRIPLFGNYVRTHTNVIFGVAIIENAYDKTNRIIVLNNEDIPKKEPELLAYAKSLMPRILVPKTDVLVVKEIGKNISGCGMDPNVTGTFGTPYASGGIKSQNVCVLDLSDASHGCGNGIGYANVTTLRFYQKMDFLISYPNSITTTSTLSCKLPMVMRDDKMAVELCVRNCHGVSNDSHRIVFIKNTLSLGDVYLSEAFLDEAKSTPGIEITGDCRPIPFDENGSLMLWAD